MGAVSFFTPTRIRCYNFSNKSNHPTSNHLMSATLSPIQPAFAGAASAIPKTLLSIAASGLRQAQPHGASTPPPPRQLVSPARSRIPAARALPRARTRVSPAALHSQVLFRRAVARVETNQHRFCLRNQDCCRCPDPPPSFNSMRVAGQAACRASGQDLIPPSQIAPGLASVQDAALAEGWIACSFTFDGFAIAGFRSCDPGLRLGADAFYYRAAVFAVTRPDPDSSLVRCPAALPTTSCPQRARPPPPCSIPSPPAFCRAASTTPHARLQPRQCA